jgi:cytochrome c-type biogenesis protein CcmH/NrfG
MFTSRNIHFALLGILLGACAGYITAFYRAQSSVQAASPLSSQPAMPADHPDLDTASMLEDLRKAAEANPASAETIARYGEALFVNDRFAEAEIWLAKAVGLAPTDLYVRSMYGVVLWELGKKDQARSALEAGLKVDPNHIPSMHGLLLLAVEDGNQARATELLQRIENVQPGYEGIPGIKARMSEAFKTVVP